MLRACHDLATGIGQHNTDIDSWKSAGMPRLTPNDYQRFPTVAPDHRYGYGSHPQQFAELTLPPTAPPHPVVILVHGGCYREIYDLRPLGALAADLADAGFAVWNIEYRRYGNGGRFPRMFLDVAKAVDHLRLIANEHHLDLERVIAMGHSAGGHLALWLAGRPKIPPESPLYNEDPLPIRAVLALAPLADIKRAVEAGLCSDALPSVMGGDPITAADNFHAGSPRELLPLDVQQTIIVGADDIDILENARAYCETAKSLGDVVSLLELPRAGHFEVVAIGSPPWQVVREALLKLDDTRPNRCGSA